MILFKYIIYIYINKMNNKESNYLKNQINIKDKRIKKTKCYRCRSRVLINDYIKHIKSLECQKKSWELWNTTFNQEGHNGSNYGICIDDD